MATSTSSISGLASGLDTASLVSQLMQIEAQPQNLLKTRLSTTQSTAAAYRSVNTRFDALRSAAEALTASSLAAAKSAVSTDPSVTASATSAASAGSSVAFSVAQLSATETQMSTGTWKSPSDDVAAAVPAEPAWPIQVFQDGKPVRTISLPDGHTSLLDAVAAINASGYGLKATIVQIGEGQYKLQVASTTSGEKGVFGLASNGRTAVDSSFTRTAEGKNALLDLGGVEASSATNTFADLLPGVAVTVSKQTDTRATVSVGSDANSVADKVKALVDAANAALAEIDKQTASSSTKKAALTGDFTVSDLTGRVLTAVSDAVGGASSATFGLQTTRDGQLTFDRSAFLSAYNADPAKVSRMLSGAEATTSTVNGTTTTTPAVTGIAQRLAALAKSATDATTGTLTTLANGQETRAKDLQTQIDAWDLRLAARKATLSAQFNAMETALSTLKNQSSWLSQQLNSLSSSSNNK